MKLPALSKVTQEAAIVIGGAILAAFVIGQFPALKTWMKNQWDGAPH